MLPKANDLYKMPMLKILIQCDDKSGQLMVLAFLLYPKRLPPKLVSRLSSNLNLTYFLRSIQCLSIILGVTS